MLELRLEIDCELATVSLAHIYFERLVLRNVVSKPNRKLMGATGQRRAQLSFLYRPCPHSDGSDAHTTQ